MSSDFEFYSKRNRVVLSGGIVKKYFTSAESVATEVLMLTRLKAAGVPVPQLIARKDRIITMSYVEGETLLDFLTRMETCSEKALLMQAANALIDWLALYYRAVDARKTAQIRGDVNGRNFLWDGSCFWGVDFEETAYGPVELDIGRLLAFVLSYEPMHTPAKAKFADRLLQRAISVLSADKTAVLRFRDAELLLMPARRATRLNSNQSPR